jgi:hypothetical protein
LFVLQFDKARPEIQGLWHAFVKISLLDYRTLIKSFAKPFIWVRLHLRLLVHKLCLGICLISPTVH